MTTRVILDTDIGTDVDDCLALAVILGSPELSLEGVTCVYGDVDLRARMVLKLLRLAGRDDVPVMLGAREPLLRLLPIYWPGHEGKGLLEPVDQSLAPRAEHAVDYLVRTVMENPGEIHLLAVGPLTNVALAFQREPRLATNLAHLTIMAGAVRGPESLDLPFAEHNVVCDPEAAHVVLAAGAPTTLVPLDVTTRVEIRADGVAALRAGHDPFQDAVARQVELYPRYVDRGSTFLHDPLAAALVVRPELADFVDLRVEVETQGRLSVGITLARLPESDETANARVALGIEVAEAERFIAARMAQSGTGGAQGAERSPAAAAIADERAS